MSDFEQVRFDPSQFQEWQKLQTVHNNALWRIAESITLLKDHLQEAIEASTSNETKWLAIQNETITAGFALVAEALTKTTLPPPQPQMEVKFVFKVANDHQDESFSISIGGVTDAEGEPLGDTKGLTVAVTSSDDSVVSASFDPATNSGVAHFGKSGVASLSASVTNAKGDILGSGAADFTVTTSDPAAVSDVKMAFGGLTEETPEPQV